MGDGSNLGISADRALKTILGGEPEPTGAEEQTAEQVRERIATATPDSYGGATDCLTRAVLRLFDQREECQVWPSSPEYAWTLPDGTRLTNDEARARGLWERSHGDMVDAETGARWGAHGPDLFATAKEVATEEERKAFEGSTGFMWGFAVNQARWLLGQHIGSNPAIVTMNIPD